MKNLAIDGSMEKWLLQQLITHGHCFAKKPLLLDVGAYHGDFAAALLATSVSRFQKAILFEPNSLNLQFLQQRFAGNASVDLEPHACDAVAGERKFFCAGETYTGSLLPYGAVPDKPVRETVVRCLVLDDFLAQRKQLDQVGLLKIDTQGNDLRVLQGAAASLRASRPVRLPRSSSNSGTPAIAAASNTAPILQPGFPCSMRYNKSREIPARLAKSVVVILRAMRPSRMDFPRRETASFA